MAVRGFHGSYAPEDVTFLLKPIVMEPTDVLVKERKIQSGECHYSEMLSAEHAPSPRYLEVFREAFDRNRRRFARDVCRLARIIDARRPRGPLTLVSLARAGTPVGVLLRRTLTRHMGREARHFSVSIIRDRGIDVNALRYILEEADAAPESLIFVDGWTGKGVIGRELRRAVPAFNARHGTAVSPALHVVADLCGAADAAATDEDYLLPSGVLNATISGLISRSVLNARYIGPEDFHGCVYYEALRDDDLSRWFVDELTPDMAIAQRELETAGPVRALSEAARAAARATSAVFVREAMRRYGVREVNYVKPGIGEATRVLLRRTPDLVLLRDASAPDVRHLDVLAGEKQVLVIEEPDLPYAAAALLRDVIGDGGRAANIASKERK